MSAFFRRYGPVTLGLAVLALGLLSLAPPARAVILFKSHPFAASKSEIADSAPVFDCSNDSSGSPLCEKHFRYMDLDWMVKYRFEQDRLTQVLLFTKHTQTDRTFLLEELSKDFHLAALKRGQKVLDLVHLSSRVSGNRFKRMVKKFEQQGLAEDDLVYVFLEKAGLNRRAKEAKNIREMMAEMSVLTRELDIWVEDSEQGKRMVLSFAMPRATMRLRPQVGKAAYETPKKSSREKIGTQAQPKPERRRSGLGSYPAPISRGEGRL